MPIPVAPKCLLLCNRVALRLLSFDQAKTQRQQEHKNAEYFLKISSGKLRYDNAQAHTCGRALGLYSCDAFSMSECMSECIRSLHAQTRTSGGKWNRFCVWISTTTVVAAAAAVVAAAAAAVTVTPATLESFRMLWGISHELLWWLASWLVGWFVGGNAANNSQCKQNLLSSVSRELCVNESACSHTSLLCAPAKF